MLADAGSGGPVPVRTILVDASGSVLATLGLHRRPPAAAPTSSPCWRSPRSSPSSSARPSTSSRRASSHAAQRWRPSIVFLVGVGILFGAMIYAFVRPIVDQAQKFVDDFPPTSRTPRRGGARRPAGPALRRRRVGRARTRTGSSSSATTPAPRCLQRALGAWPARSSPCVTILVLAFLMILEGPTCSQAAFLNVIDSPRAAKTRPRPPRRGRLRHGRSPATWPGNLLISVIAGVADVHRRC